MHAAAIRLATVADAARIAAIYAPYVTAAATSFEIDPPSADEMGRRIVATVERWPWLVCERDHEVLGYAYATRHHERAAYQWSVDVSVYVDDRVHGRGIGRALYTSLFPLLVLQGFHNAYAGITLPNAASVGLHEAMGFRAVGVYRRVGFKLGAWHDVGWWGRELQSSAAPPGPPLTIAESRGLPGWEAAMAAGVASLRL